MLANVKLTILIIDDNSHMRAVINELLADSGHKVLLADGHQQALSFLEQESIDLILMDIEMPHMDGYELTRLIRAQYTKWIPIIFLSGNTSDQALEKGIEAGGDDYLTKPVSQIILNAKISAMARIAAMQNHLDELNRKLQKLSNQDVLTKVLNRRALEDKLKQAWQSYKDDEQTFSLLMIDIDHFKRYNDDYGHPAGDQCLKRFALLLKQNVSRDLDIIARYGGEEFVVVAPGASLAEAQIKADRIITAINQEKIEHNNVSTGYLTASIGIAVSDSNVSHYRELVKRADDALYRAKEQGRNQWQSS